MNAKKILVVYGYDRIVPPFIQTLIKYGCKRFDEIYYITAPIPDYDAKTINDPKVKIITWTLWQRVLQYVYGLTSIFRVRFWEEFFKGKPTLRAFKYIGQMYFCMSGFMNMSDKIISGHLKAGNQIYILGTWMAVDAFTAAMMKRKYPTVKAYALAHSGEVMIDRTPNLFQCFHEFKHEYLDVTYFISEKVLNGYLKSMDKFKIAQRFKDRIRVRYLGCIRKSDSRNPANNTDTLQILSCSRMDANKRLDKIVSALYKWNSGKIKWTHIGIGVLEDEIKEFANDLVAANPLVKVNFTGRLDNSDVIKYYEENPVDLFLNVSKSEGLPISIMEAMSFGIPCAATDVGGTSEIVNDSNGYLLPMYFSAEELLRVISRCKTLGSAEKHSMRENAFLTWSTLFNAEKNAMNLFNEWLDS